MNRTAPAFAIIIALAALAGAQEADLAITKFSAPVIPVVWDHTFTVRVENLGPDPASGITVTDLLTHDVMFDSASPGCSYQSAGHSVVCTISELAPGTAVDLEIVVLNAAIPNRTEPGIVLTCAAPGLGPAVAIIGTRYNQHEVFASGNHLAAPRGIAREAGPSIVVADAVDLSAQAGGVPLVDGRVIRIDRSTGGQILLSSGGELLNPTGIAVDDNGRIFVADPTGPVLPEQLGRVIEIDPVTGAQTVRGTGNLIERPWGIDVLMTGELIVADAVGRLVRVNPDTGGKTLVSEYGALSRPRGVAQISPQAVLVADADSGLVRVELANGAQTVIMAIDGVNLCEPIDVEAEYWRDMCWVADQSCGGTRMVHRIDCDTGTILETDADESWSSPWGIALLDILTNRASVTSSTPDPDPSNNSDWVATEMEEDYEPAIEVDVDEMVAVTDEVTIEIHTPVVIEIEESIVVADGVGVRPAARIDVNEIVTMSDTMVVQPAVRISLVESITVSDQYLTAPALQITVTEGIAVTDGVQFPGLTTIFSDGFENGDTSAWSSTIGGL